MKTDEVQEDPFKLAVVAKDLSGVCVVTADFIFGDEEMGIVTSDEEGVLRIYAYDPSGTIPLHLGPKLT